MSWELGWAGGWGVGLGWARPVALSWGRRVSCFGFRGRISGWGLVGGPGLGRGPLRSLEAKL